MASRAQHLQEHRDGHTVEVNLLSRARNVVEQTDCLRPDGADADAILTSLARFDVLSNIAVLGASDADDDRVFYPNFAQFRQDRIQPVVDQVLVDHEMRHAIFAGPDEQLARALETIGMGAQDVGRRYDGFMTWEGTPVGDFIGEQLPPEERRVGRF